MTATCLGAHLAEAEPGELDIVVACNRCTDCTATCLATFRSEAPVVSTEKTSKAGGLELGDPAARGFPHLYVDADVVLPTAAVRTIAHGLRDWRGLVLVLS